MKKLYSIITLFCVTFILSAQTPPPPPSGGGAFGSVSPIDDSLLIVTFITLLLGLSTLGLGMYKLSKK